MARISRGTPPFRGKVRFLRRLDNALRALEDGRLEERIDGLRYRLDTRDLIDFNVLYLGGHQRALVDLIADHLHGPTPVFWDIGANVGSISLPIAHSTPGVRVEAFEPSPRVFHRLRTNLSLNPDLTPRVRLHPWALSMTTGEASFYASKETTNSGVGGLGHSRNREDRAVSVTVKRGDDLIAEGAVAPPDLIKIDVEGFEIEVLRGLEAFLRTTPKLALIYEHQLYRLIERAKPIEEVSHFLEALGFELRMIRHSNRATLATHPLRHADLESDCDIVALR